MLRAYIGTANGVPDIGNNIVAAKGAVTPVAGGWCDVLWDDPFTIDYGPDNFYLLITYAFTDPADQMKYIVVDGVPSESVPSVAVGTTLVLSEQSAGYPRGPRGKYSIADGDTLSSPYWSGVDIVVDEMPAPTETPPTAAYNFATSGSVATDITGHGHHLTTQPSYFTPNGYAGGGLRQVGAADEAVNQPFTALDTTISMEFTIMFWGKYDSPGTAGSNWSVYQTAANDNNISWGIALSDGTNTVFGLRVQGADNRLTAPRQPVGQWHHYALVRNEHYTRVYCDGVMVSEVHSFGVVGSDSDHNIRIFGGSMQDQTIDELYFFSEALAPSAIAYYMDPASIAPARSGKVKIWNGTDWQAHPLKMWNGTVWSPRPVGGSADAATFIRGKG